MTDVYEFSEFDRQNLVYNFSRMTPAEVGTAKEKARKADEEAAAKKAAAAAAKQAAPAAPRQEPPAALPPATQQS
jgi:NADH-quinone oxidoreductase subunit I